MSTYKLAYNFRYVATSPRRVDIVAVSFQDALHQLAVRLWWDCISLDDVNVNLVGKSSL